MYIEGRVLLFFSSENNNEPTRQKLRGKNKYLVAVGYDSKEVEILDLDNFQSGFRVLTELPLRYGLNGASVAAHGDYLVKLLAKTNIRDIHKY